MGHPLQIEIVHTNHCNVTAVANLFDELGLHWRIRTSASDVNGDVLVLPGVGSASTYMKSFEKSGFQDLVYEFNQAGKLIIGICLGYQILTKMTEEDGGVEGLGLIDARCNALKAYTSPGTNNGWGMMTVSKETCMANGFDFSRSTTRKRLLRGRAYYNHEFGVVPSESVGHFPINNRRLSVFSGLFVRNNIVGMQFHPEKSQVFGLKLMELLLK